MFKRILSLMLALMLLASLAVSVSAHDVPDRSRLGSVTITMTHRGDPIPGGSLKLVRVADVVSDDGDYLFAYPADFAECTIPVTELDSADLPAELAVIAKEKDVAGVTQTIDELGQVVFSDLELGLYLLIQEEAAPGFKKVNPFLVSVPYNDNGTYIYDVDTAPKNLPGPEEEPTEPPTEPTEPPDGPDLPQTGQTNWPVPVLAMMGMLLVLAGLGFCKAGKREDYEV